jgi:1-aminocyclopropane-1-carboxylate deaminase/D-cysteine desulfhydrase-like pyridoxal-dependent ACC family enzyme
VDKSDLWVDEKYFGEGYGEPTKKSREAAKIFCDIEGILVDPVYTSKTAAALIDYCQQNVFNPDDNVLFWHTGGIMTFFV